MTANSLKNFFNLFGSTLLFIGGLAFYPVAPMAAGAQRSSDQDDAYFRLYPDEKNEVLSAAALRGRAQQPALNNTEVETEAELRRLLGTWGLPPNTTRSELDKFLLSRLPPLKVPATAQNWTQQGQALRHRVLEEVVMKGHDPAIFRQSPAVQWQGIIETGHGYRIRKLCYEMWPGFWGPALIYEPVDLQGPAPVVLNTMGHGGVLSNDFRQTRVINLVKRGMICMVVEWIGSGGELSTSREVHGYLHDAWIECFDLCGRNGIAPFHTTLTRALDILLEQPHADASRVAVTGYSSGGTQALWLGALDDRVTVCVPVAGHAGNEAFIRHYSFGCPTMVPCDLWARAGFSQLTALLAPRPTLLIYNKFDDCCWQSDWVRPSLVDPIKPFYSLFGRTDHFAYFEGTEKDPGHNYGRMNRQALYQFLNRHFFDQSDGGEEIPCDDELLFHELRVDLPADNMNVHRYFEKYATGLPAKPLHQAVQSSGLGAWQTGRRQALRDNLKLPTYNVTKVTESQDIPSDRYNAQQINLQLGNDWHIPAVDISLPNTTPTRVAIVLADGGRSEGALLVDKLLRDGHRCVAIDVLFVGECFPTGWTFPNAEFAVHSFGARNLGIKVAQLSAVTAFVAEKYPDLPITIAGVGLNSSVTTAIAVAVANDIHPAMLITVGLPATLKVLVERSMFRAYSLFNFGLLKEVDISEILALCLPTQVQLINVESSDYQWKYPKWRAERALRSFVNRAATFRQKIDIHQKEYKPGTPLKAVSN